MVRLHFRLSVLGVLSVLVVACLIPTSAIGQASFTAQLRGTVTDASGGVVPRATVTLTNDGTKVSEKTTSDEAGRYIFNGLQPASYTVKVEASGFKAVVRSNIVLRVGLQTDVDFTLEVGQVTQTVEVTGAAPLLNTVNAALGTEVTNRYIMDLPLINRSISSLTYLAPGVSEVIGSRISQMGGTVFASNGQRYGTAEFRADGTLITYPEGGEGGTTAINYKPLIEDIQEFKVQNNSFSAEFGNNGGTVVNMVTKSGSNQFHGSGFYFFRRPRWDANNFFANRDCPPPGDPARPPDGCKGEYQRDQIGGSIGGPIIKQKTFFFFDFEKIRDNGPSTITATVPTMLQRQGDFSQTFLDDGNGNPLLEQIFNPYDATVVRDPATGGIISATRAPFANNQITGNCNKPDPLNPSTVSVQPCLDPVAVNLMKLWPEPTGPGDAITGQNNYAAKIVERSPVYQFDWKIDHNFTDKSRMFVRFGRKHAIDTSPEYASFLSDFTTKDNIHNAVVAYDWTPTPTILWTTRAGVDRFHEGTSLKDFDATTVGFPKYLEDYNGLKRLPAVEVEDYDALVGSNCADTIEAHTQYMVASSVTKVIHSHNLKFGGEMRWFLNNFWQPCDTNGSFEFDRAQTAADIFNAGDFDGNGIASVLTGFGAWGGMGSTPHNSNKSKDQGFFVHDEWKVTQRLTLNMGLRYEWSTPYTERFDRLQWDDFTTDSGIFVPALGPDWPGKEIIGITRLAGPGHRTIRTDRNNFGPRLGFAYRLNPKTVLRAGAGIYYGFNVATNFQYVGTAWSKDIEFKFSKDGGITRFASLQNPLPLGYGRPAGPRYGPLSRWGFDNGNNLSDNFRNAEIYQWNFGIERELAGNILIDANYSANRSVHLPWHGGTRNRNFVGRADREQWGTDGLAELVPNPFQYLFQGSDAIFDEPDSDYNDVMIPRINLLRPFPQFNGSWEGLPLMAATSSYHSLQVRFEKRYSRGLNFLGHYTFSKFIDTGSEGANPWIGDLRTGNVQDPTNLKAEKGISANDTPHRLTFAVTYELPVGRGKHFGGHMNRGVDAVVGGWKFVTWTTFQTGTPIDIKDRKDQLADGRQRPNVNGNPRSTLSVQDVVDGKGRYFDASVFSHPGDQVLGNAPRYFSHLRNPGVHNLDLSLFKSFPFGESKRLELRAEFVNFTNTPRFLVDRRGGRQSFGSSGFGKIVKQFNSARRAQIGIRFVF